MVEHLPTMRETPVPSPGGEDPLEEEMQPTLVLLPGKSHGRSLVGYSLWGRKELDMTERRHFTSLQSLAKLTHKTNHHRGRTLILFSLPPAALSFRTRIMQAGSSMGMWGEPQREASRSLCLDHKRRHRKKTSPFCLHS